MNIIHHTLQVIINLIIYLINKIKFQVLKHRDLSFGSTIIWRVGQTFKVWHKFSHIWHTSEHTMRSYLLFSMYCIYQSIESNKCTPICRQQLNNKRSGTHLNSSQIWFGQNRCIATIVNDLKNKMQSLWKGCRQEILLESLALHLTQCTYNSVVIAVLKWVKQKIIIVSHN